MTAWLNWESFKIIWVYPDGTYFSTGMIIYFPTTETDYDNIVYSYNKTIINKTEVKENSARSKLSPSSHYQNSIKFQLKLLSCMIHNY